MRHLLLATLVALSPLAFAKAQQPSADQIAKAKFAPKTVVVRTNLKTGQVEMAVAQEGLRKGQKADHLVFQTTALNAEKRNAFSTQTASNELDKSTSTASWYGGVGGGYGFRGGLSFRGGYGGGGYGGYGRGYGGGYGGGFSAGYGYSYPGYGYGGYGYYSPYTYGYGYSYPYSNCYYGYSDYSSGYSYGYYGLASAYGYDYGY